MCTQLAKELKMRRGYADVVYFFKTANVRRDVIGCEFLEIATMYYLKDPSLEPEEILKFVAENATRGHFDEKDCLNEMKKAIETIHVSNFRKLDKDNAVFDFIENAATEIRLRSLLEIRRWGENLTAITEKTMTVFCTVTIQRIAEPKVSFQNLLRCLANECQSEYDELVLELYKVVRNQPYASSVKGKSEEEILKMMAQDVEYFVSLAIKNLNQMIF